MMSGDAPLVWCHECRRETVPHAHEWACSLCDGGFIEAVDEGGVEGTGVITVECVGKDRRANVRYPLACPFSDFQELVCTMMSVQPGTAAWSLHGEAINGEELTLAECGLKDGSVVALAGTFVETAGERGMRMLDELQSRYDDALQHMERLQSSVALSQQQQSSSEGEEGSGVQKQTPRELHKEALRINELFMRMLETLDSIETDESRPQMREIRKQHVVNIQQRQSELDAITSAVGV